jgi:TPR repeat protein
MFSINSAFAEIKTFIKEYTYQACDFDSKDSSRTLALETIKRLLLEELGTYLISETEVKNMELTKDQVVSYSAGIVSAVILEDKWDGKSYWIKSKVSADPLQVEKALKKLVEDKYKLKELDENKNKVEELLKENNRLRAALEKADKTQNMNNRTKDIKAYNETITRLNAEEYFQLGLIKHYGGNRQEAIKFYIRAARLGNIPAQYFLKKRGIAW